LRKALANEQREYALTKKANIALNDKYCVLDEKHKNLEMRYNLVWKSTSHPSKAKDTSTPSTSQGCGKCYNADLNVYSTNLANIEAIRKEITRLNAMLNKSGKDDQSKRPQYKDGRLPHIKDELDHKKGNKTNGRKVINGFECVQFISKGKIDTERPAQSVTQNQPEQHSLPSAAVPHPQEKGRSPTLPLLMISPRSRSTK
jgi:hypothetical protein